MAKKLHIENDCIVDSEFKDVNMTGTTFTNINLSGARFTDINFSDVDFSFAQIGGCVFREIDVAPDAKAAGVKQRPVTFEDTSLYGSVFRRVDLTGASFTDCELADVTIDGIPLAALLAAYRQLNG